MSALLRIVYCSFAVAWYWLLARIQGCSLYVYVNKWGNQKTMSLGYRCLLIWLFVSAIRKKKPDQIVNLLSLAGGRIKIRGKSVIACIEAAIWQNDRQNADELLDIVKHMKRISPETIKYLRGLYAWRFLKDSSIVLEMRDVPVAAVLDFVLTFARATALDEQGSHNDALIFYRSALKAMPHDTPQYKHAMERCNVLLNV